MSTGNATLQPPRGVEKLLELLSREVLRQQPKDVKAFAARLFAEQLTERVSANAGMGGEVLAADEAAVIDGATISAALDSLQIDSLPAGVSPSQDAVAASAEPEPEPEFEPPRARRGRRVSVSAESMNPDMFIQAEKVVHHKTDDVKARILSMVKGNFLFNNLDTDQLDEVVLSMFEKPAKAGEDVIKQGEDGDYFYVVESGTFDIFVTPYQEEPANVGSIGTGGSFGELALMYNAPRAATIHCTSDAVLWAMDRMTFRRILMDTTSKKRRMYESFLSSIEILSCIEPYERVKIADGLDSQNFVAGEDVIKQGEVGDKFYLVEKGELVAIVDDMEVAHLKKGDYFGELALLFSQPRKATVRATGDVTVAFLDIEAFNRMLGPCSEIMKRSMSHYDEEVAEAKKRAHA